MSTQPNKLEAVLVIKGGKLTAETLRRFDVDAFIELVAGPMPSWQTSLMGAWRERPVTIPSRIGITTAATYPSVP